MPLISDTIPTLVNGVSQQPDSLRLTSQCTLQENAYSSPVKGVRKRPPFRHLAQIFNTAGHEDDYVHTINRDAAERYQVFITNGDLKVFDIAGNAKTVNFPSGKAYLTAATPRSMFHCLTVADYTFITNKTVICAMDGSLSTVRHKDALIYVKQGSYGMTYNVYLDAFAASTTRSTTVVTSLNTDTIAFDLLTQLSGDTATAAKFNLTQYGSVIYVQCKNAGDDFTLTSADGQGNNALIVVKDTIQLFQNLPQTAVDGFSVRVIGDSSGSYDGYYVSYSDASTSSNSGTWVETTGQGVANVMDATTLPWQLVRNSDGTFTFDKAAWANRTVGDDSSAPRPSFIGKAVADIFFYRNRLGFLAGQNVIMSKAGQFFTFWPDTATDLLDSDRIDVAANHTKVSTLRAVVAYQDDLLAFSDLTQFDVSGGSLLSPKTITILPASEFENNSQLCIPVSTGKNVYFTLSRGSFTGLREYLTLPVSQTRDAPEVTAHVPQYVPANVFKIASTNNEEMLALLTLNERNAIYTYKYFWNGDQKLQSSWSKWPLDAGDVVLNVDFIDTDIYATIQRSDGVYLEVASIEIGRQDVGFTFQVNLDRRLYLTGSYNSGTGKTTWTLPYVMTGGVFQVILGAAFSTPNETGDVLTVAYPTTSTITAVGDYSAGPVYIGRQYTDRYRFSQQYVRERNTQTYASEANTEGRLQLNRFSINYESTGYFRAEVTPYARSMNTYTFTGFILGDAQSLVGGRPVPSGVFRFPVLSDSRTVQIDLVNDSYLPSGFQQASWEGKYYLRSTRI